jgi:hypothetical protein
MEAAAALVSQGTANMTELAANVGRALAAGNHADVGIGISGTGLLVFFLLGALDALTKAGVIKPGVTPLAGSSGGSVLALAQCTGVSNAVFLNESMRLTDFCESHFNCAARFGPALRTSIRNAVAALPPGGAERAFEACNGRLFTQLSIASHPVLWNQGREVGPAAARLFGGGPNDTAVYALPFVGPNAQLQRAVVAASDALAPKLGSAPNAVGRKLCGVLGGSPALRAAYASLNRSPRPNSVTPWVVSRYDGVEDGINAAMASSLNPIWSAPALTTSYRGVSGIVDGVYSDPLPCAPLPNGTNNGASNCIRLSAVAAGYSIGFSDKPIVNPTIAPGMRVKRPGMISPEESMCYNLVIPSRQARLDMFDLGVAEAEAFLDEVEALSEWRREGGGGKGKKAAVGA